MGTAATNDRYEDALALYNGGDFRAARDLALQGLADEPKDVNLLRLAGRSGDHRESGLLYDERSPAFGVALSLDGGDRPRGSRG